MYILCICQYILKQISIMKETLEKTEKLVLKIQRKSFLLMEQIDVYIHIYSWILHTINMIGIGNSIAGNIWGLDALIKVSHVTNWD